MVAGIYQILNTVNNKRYIGSSVNLTKRKSQHKKELEKNSHSNTHLQAAYNKYGKEFFSIDEILICEISDLEFYEQLIIDSYQANNKKFGYNIRTVCTSNKGMQTKRNTHKVGDKYNRLTLVKPLYMVRDCRKWLAKCDCGNEIEVMPGDVRHNHTKSCGCLNIEKRKERIINYNLRKQ